MPIPHPWVPPGGQQELYSCMEMWHHCSISTHCGAQERRHNILRYGVGYTHPFSHIRCCLWRGKNQKHFSLETFPSVYVVFLSRTSVVIPVSFPSLDTRLNRREGNGKGRGSRENEEERRKGWRENGREQEEGRDGGREILTEHLPGH